MATWEDFTKAEKHEVLDPLRLRAAELRLAAENAQSYCDRVRTMPEPPRQTTAQGRKVYARTVALQKEKLAKAGQRARDATREAEGLEAMILYLCAMAGFDCFVIAELMRERPAVLREERARRDTEATSRTNAFLGMMTGQMKATLKRTR